MYNRNLRTRMLSAGLTVTTILTGIPVYAAESETTPTNYEIVEEMGARL